MKKTIEKYLTSYAEPAATCLADFPETYDQAIVIPVYDDTADLLYCLKHFPKASCKVLIIIVINCAIDAPEHAVKNNTALLNYFAKSYSLKWSAHTIRPLKLYATTFGDALIIDCSSPNFAFKHKIGVGRARKIGADVAAQLWSQRQLRSPWLANTDADAILPADYFMQLNALPDHYSAATFPFQHPFDKGCAQQKTAMQNYERYLHHYVDGLSRAGSPYAFHTIGSCIAVHLDAYCQVRGFPKREAGEDFYILNKLAKIAPVMRLNGKSIQLSSRLSHRTPFGTGQALQKIMQSSEHAYQLYPSESFTLLKTWIDWINQAQRANYQLSLLMDEKLKLALAQFSPEDTIKKIAQNSGNDQQFRKHCHDWFDAFKTLKFIHAVC